MAKIEDFEKRYVAHVDFREGDKILVTEENIEQLRDVEKHKFPLGDKTSCYRT